MSLLGLTPALSRMLLTVVGGAGMIGGVPAQQQQQDASGGALVTSDVAARAKAAAAALGEFPASRVSGTQDLTSWTWCWVVCCALLMPARHHLTAHMMWMRLRLWAAFPAGWQLYAGLAPKGPAPMVGGGAMVGYGAHNTAALQAMEAAKKAAAALGLAPTATGVPPEPDHFEEELEINDYPQHARWKATHKDR